MSVSPADQVLRLYQTHADAFSRLRSRSLMEREWLDRFLEALPPDGREVLDIGCGDGEPIALYLIGRGARLTGVDGAPALLTRAAKRFPDQRWLVADMRALPLAGPFDGLLLWHSLFHLRPGDQRPLFPRLAGLLRPGGALLFTSGTELGEVIGQFQGAPLYHGSLDSAEYASLLRANGFDILRHVVGDAGCGGANIWLARRLPA